jgi:hypothetical protein
MGEMGEMGEMGMAWHNGMGREVIVR